MSDDKIKIRLKGHESFYIREGWLTKGIKNVEENPRIFLQDNATEELGMGTNMVKSLRYWLQACKITEERNTQGGKREQHLTQDFGELIYENDKYFEDIFSIWLVHYKLATNKELCTSWYLFFNEVNVTEFTRDDFKEEMVYALNRYTNNADYSEKSLFDDCECIKKTYISDKKQDRNPEDNNICPLSELGLLSIANDKRNREIIKKVKPSIDKLDKMVVLYIILDNLKGEKNVSFDNVLNNKCNAGKVLNLDRNLLNIYLDLLKNDKLIHINRTAGLDQIYINDITTKEIITEYYEQLKE